MMKTLNKVEIKWNFLNMVQSTFENLIANSILNGNDYTRPRPRL